MPNVLLPPLTPFTLQVTAGTEPEAACTAKAVLCPSATAAFAGVTLSADEGGAELFEELLPPPHPLERRTKERATAKMHSLRMALT